MWNPRMQLSIRYDDIFKRIQHRVQHVFHLCRYCILWYTDSLRISANISPANISTPLLLLKLKRITVKRMKVRKLKKKVDSITHVYQLDCQFVCRRAKLTIMYFFWGRLCSFNSVTIDDSSAPPTYDWRLCTKQLMQHIITLFIHIVYEPYNVMAIESTL